MAKIPGPIFPEPSTANKNAKQARLELDQAILNQLSEIATSRAFPQLRTERHVMHHLIVANVGELHEAVTDPVKRHSLMERYEVYLWKLELEEEEAQRIHQEDIVTTLVTKAKRAITEKDWLAAKALMDKCMARKDKLDSPALRNRVMKVIIDLNEAITETEPQQEKELVNE